jgi:hypothetical protein
MTRYEIKTPHKSFAGCEPTPEEAKAYVAGLIRAGVKILNVEYFDNQTRIDDIRAGRNTYRSELTPQGEQMVIPGCEMDAAPSVRQLSLF